MAWEPLTKPPKVLTWQYRETRDSEYATAIWNGFKVQVQDCDGDMSRWHIERDGQLLASGEMGGIKPYHFDAAKILARAVLGYVWDAHNTNEFVKSEEYREAVEVNRR